MFTKVRDKAAHKKALVATRSKHPRSLMEYLELRYPSLPADYLVNYRLYFARRPPPPLDILCPEADFTQAVWPSIDSEMAQWKQQVSDRERLYNAAFEPAMDAQLIVFVAQLLGNSDDHFPSAYRSHGFVCPDVYVCRGPTKSPMIVALMDLDNLLQVDQVDPLGQSGMEGQNGEMRRDRPDHGVENADQGHAVNGEKLELKNGEMGLDRPDQADNVGNADQGHAEKLDLRLNREGEVHPEGSEFTGSDYSDYDVTSIRSLKKSSNGIHDEIEGDETDLAKLEQASSSEGHPRMEGYSRMKASYCPTESGEEVTEGADQLPGLVLSRLYHYMHATGSLFGAVTCLKKTWICKRVAADGRDVVHLSAPLERPVMALAFLIAQARQLISSPPPSSPLKLKREFDSAPVLRQVRLACRAIKARHTDKILALVQLHLDLEAEVENAEVLTDDPERKSCMVAVRCMYKGSAVVVKARDLSSPWGLGFRESLARVVREVDAYLTMCRIQGSYVPELVEWGFSRGAMTAFVMTTDCGKARVQRSLAHEPAFSDCPEKAKALRGVMDSLREIHKRGILHGDLSDSKVVLSRSSDGEWRATLVGFAQIKYFDTTHSNEIYKEGMQLHKLVSWLMHTR